MSTKPQFQFQVGDRVAERPKPHGIFTHSDETRQRIAQYRSQRYGVVLDIKLKPSSNGRKRKVLVIQWDNLKSPSEHEQMRICPIDQLQRLTNQTLVPGE
jgi:hypothetical protein